MGESLLTHVVEGSILRQELVCITGSLSLHHDWLGQVSATVLIVVDICRLLPTWQVIVALSVATSISI